MNKAFRLVILAACLLIGCHSKKPLTAEMSASNALMKKNTAFSGFEDLTSPKFRALREKYKIDTVFDGEQDEFRRMLLLRNWIRSIIHIADFERSYPGEGYPEMILDAALKGQGYHCGHYMIVQNAVMNSFGYVTRCLGAGPGVAGGPDGHHGINEVWSNKFHKWFLSDAKYNHHFEKNGIPLSALEIRDEYLKNKAADIVLVKGPDRVPIEKDFVANAKGVMIAHSKADFARTYTWIEWESYNDRYTNWPESGHHVSILNMYADDYFKTHKWIWDGKPHWAYGTDFMKLVSERDAIEWTPNTIAGNVTIDGDVARVDLTSETPNLRSYQMRTLPDGEWHDISSQVDIRVTTDRLEEAFRAVNLAGVSGPEYRITISR